MKKVTKKKAVKKAKVSKKVIRKPAKKIVRKPAPKKPVYAGRKSSGKGKESKVRKLIRLFKKK